MSTLTELDSMTQSSLMATRDVMPMKHDPCSAITLGRSKLQSCFSLLTNFTELNKCVQERSQFTTPFSVQRFLVSFQGYLRSSC